MSEPTTPPPPPAAPAADAPAPRPRRASRWPHALGLLTWAGVAVGVPTAAVFALLTQPAALPWLLRAVPGLTATGVQGTLAGGDLRVASLDWTLPAQTGRLQITELKADGLRLRQAPHGSAWTALQWRSLSAAKVVYTSPPPSPTPTTVPTSLQLPLVLQNLPVKVGVLQIDSLPTARDVQARLSLGVEAGATHRLDDVSFTLDQARVHGHATLGSRAPLPLSATLQAQSVGSPPWQASASATGPLARLQVQARLDGQPVPDSPARQAAAAAVAPSLQAQATVLPFADWPLAALSLSTQRLDLKTLAPGLPHTVLDINAQVATQGLTAPVLVQATVDNRAPGALDTGAVPLRRAVLSLRGDAQHTDRLTLERFDLQLADGPASAGRATGKGQWQGDSLSLDLVLEALQPARLHSRAAALEIAGPVTLKASGLPVPDSARPAKAGPRPEPRLALEAVLAGRALDGTGLPVKLVLAGEGTASRLVIRQAEASAGAASARLVLDAQAQGGAAWKLKGEAHLNQFDPLPWWRGAEGTVWRRGPHRLTADLQADVLWRGLPDGGRLHDRLLLALDGDARLAISDSQLAGVPLSGQWQLRSEGRALKVDGSASAAGNKLQLAGQGGGAPADDRWQLDLQAPALAALAPLGALLSEGDPELAAWWPSAGTVQASLKVQGRWPAMRTQGELRSQGLRATTASVAQVQASWRTGDDADAPLSLQFDAQDVRSAGQTLNRLQAGVTGSLTRHQIKFMADSPLKPPAWSDNLLGPAGTGTRLDGEARGLWTASADGGGTWRLQDLKLQGGARDAGGGSRPWLAAQGLNGELRLDGDYQPKALQVDPGRVQLLTTALNWRTIRWQAAPADGRPSALTLQAELETIDVARLLARVQPDMGWGGQLALGGHIDVRTGDKVDVDIVLERVGGDLTLTDDLGAVQTLGVTDLRLALSAHDGVWQFAQGLAGAAIGEMAGAQVMRTTADRRWPSADSALQGVIESRVSNLNIWGAWVPPGWRLGGALRTTASIGGTLGAPEFRGEMRGSGLVVRNVLQGVNLSDGEVAITLGGQQAHIERAVFKGGEGQLTISGDAVLGSTPGLTLQLTADKFRALGRIDRRIVASGQAQLALDSSRLKLDGRFTVDEGQIDISQGSAPGLDDDVTVTRAASAPGAASAPREPLAGDAGKRADAASAAAAPGTARNAQVAVVVNLGQKLKLRGRGVDTTLVGELTATTPGGKLALAGTVRSENGSFAAYGQQLEISRGEIVFTGPADNPRLDVRATRPNLDVVVGVAITGTALNPRVRLFSEPELADYDKLSWLVLGRSPDGLGRTDTALLQRAATALLAGDGKAPTDELLNALGITDFSVRQTEGTVRETVVSLGRQLSRRWYVGYERSVNATTGTWQLVYRVAQRFTLRAQSGNENALDAIWSWRW